jgi:hypothetical protein
MLSESLSKELFGDADPMDKIVKIENRLEVVVTGVYDNGLLPGICISTTTPGSDRMIGGKMVFLPTYSSLTMPISIKFRTRSGMLSSTK